MLSKSKSLPDRQAGAFGGKKINIIIAGEGGQGVQTVAKILSTAIFNQGQEVTYMPSFGVEQRGTPSVAYFSFSSDPLRYPKFTIADYAVILQTRAISSVEKYISPNTKVIFDSSTISHNDLPKTAVHLLGIPATLLANTKFNTKAFNIIILGALTNLLELSADAVWSEISNTLGKKFTNESIKQQNREAFLYGHDSILEKNDFTKASIRPKHTSILYKGFGKVGEIVPKRCKGCGICIIKCPVGALSFGEDLGIFSTPVPQSDLEKCIACGNCRNYCPDSAICFEKVKTTPPE